MRAFWAYWAVDSSERKSSSVKRALSPWRVSTGCESGSRSGLELEDECRADICPVASGLVEAPSPLEGPEGEDAIDGRAATLEILLIGW